jgi:hypothetical protein
MMELAGQSGFAPENLTTGPFLSFGDPVRAELGWGQSIGVVPSSASLDSIFAS